MNPKYKITLLTSLLIISATLLTGCIEGADQPDLRIEDFSYVKTIEGFGDYEPHEKEYSPFDEVLIYFEVAGLEPMNNKIKMSQELVASNKLGEVYVEETVFDGELKVREKDSITYLENTITPPENGFTPGTHRVQITVEDKVTGETITYEDEFIVKDTERNETRGKTYLNEDWAFQVNYPPQWSVEEQLEEEEVFRVIFSDPEYPLNFGIEAHTHENEEQQDLQQITQERIDYLKDQHGYENAEFSTQEGELIPETKKIVAKIPQEEFNIKQVTIIKLSQQEDKLYSIMATGPEPMLEEIWGPLYKEMITSFKINK